MFKIRHVLHAIVLACILTTSSLFAATHNEIETKILEVNRITIAARLKELGAVCVEDTLLSIDWIGFPPSPEKSCYLRVRSYGDKKVEITWKGKGKVQGASLSRPEINLLVNNHQDAVDLFTALGMSVYAHQEKYRSSWEWENIHFDIDTYPGMPSYLEIEADSDETIQKTIALLGLSTHRVVPAGERFVIEQIYGLDWYHMVFAHPETQLP